MPLHPSCTLPLCLISNIPRYVLYFISFGKVKNNVLTNTYYSLLLQDVETLGDILQRRIARYGSDDGVGTRTNTGKTSAKSKYSKYLQVLGEIRE